MAFNSYKGQFDTRVSSLIDKYFELKMLQLQGERLADIVLTEPETSQEQINTSRTFSWNPVLRSLILRFRYAETRTFGVRWYKSKNCSRRINCNRRAIRVVEKPPLSM